VSEKAAAAHRLAKAEERAERGEGFRDHCTQSFRLLLKEYTQLVKMRTIETHQGDVAFVQGVYE
jgi:hypothetical protein